MNKSQYELLVKGTKTWNLWKLENPAKFIDLRGADLSGLVLEGIDLTGADLREAQMEEIDLVCADLRGVNLTKGNLRNADLRRVNLRNASLGEADLQGAYLKDSDLTYAYLRNSNLRNTTLKYTDLLWTDLRGADLRGSQLPSPTIVLLANWGELPDDITIALMRLDASSHPDPTSFDKWSETRGCPYTDCQFQRVANFGEKKDLWSPGAPPTIWEAMKMVLDYHCPGWDEKDENKSP